MLARKAETEVLHGGLVPGVEELSWLWTNTRSGSAARKLTRGTVPTLEEFAQAPDATTGA